MSVQVKKFTRGWLKDPRKARAGEVIGGGWFVFRRGGGTNRIRPALYPFEYGSEDAALEQARKLGAANPGQTFIIVGQSQAVMFPVQEAA